MADDDIIVGSAAVEIVPSAKGWIAKAKAQILPQAEELGRSVGEAIADQIASEIRTAMSEGLAGAGTVAKAKGRESGQDFGGEFARQAQTRIQAALKALPKADVGVDATEAEIKLAEIRARMEALGDKQIGVDLDAASAITEMAELEAALHVIAADTVEIDVQVNTGKAIAELAAFQGFAKLASGGEGIGGGASGLASAAGSAGRLAGSMGTAATAAGVFGAAALLGATAIVPIVGAAAGIAAALAAPLGAATVGGFLFAGIGGAAVKNVEEARKSIEQLESKLETATDPKVVARLTDELKSLKSGLSDTERQYLKARDNLGSAFADLMDGPGGDAVLGTINEGLELAADLLPEVEPLLVATSDALRDMLEGADPEKFGAWVDKLAELAGTATTDVIDILGDVGGAIDAVLTAGSGTGESALSGIADAAERLNEYLRSPEGQEDLQVFFEWLATDGKDAGEALWNTAGALADLALAAEPVGSAVLDVLNVLAELASVVATLEEAKRSVATLDFSGAFDELLGGAEAVAATFPGLGPIIRAPFISTFDAIELVFGKFADLLDILPDVPPFDWAEDAADKLRGAARGAGDVADNLRDIPKSTNPKIGLDDKASAGLRDIQAAVYRLSNGATVPINIQTKGVIPNLNDIYSRIPGQATGGPVFGPGTGTSDSVLRWLSNGEHVLTAAEVRASGGHGAVEAMRRQMLAGQSAPSAGQMIDNSAERTMAAMRRRSELRDTIREAVHGMTFTDPDNGRRLRGMVNGGY